MFSDSEGAADASSVRPCQKAGCLDGYFREVCGAGRVRDAECKIGTTLFAIALMTPLMVITLAVCVMRFENKADAQKYSWFRILLFRFAVLCVAGGLVVGCVFAVLSGDSKSGVKCEICTKCPAGHEPSGQNMTECSPCKPGTSASAGAEACEPCPAGTYSAGEGKF